MKTKPEIRRYAQPVFRFKRYRTLEACFEQHMSPPGEKVRWRLKDVTVGDSLGKETSALEMVEQMKPMGMWGFVETRAKPPLIHYWTDGKRTEEELIHFFSHEMGHCTGKPAKRGWPEENRADDYGYVANLAVAAARKVLRR